MGARDLTTEIAGAGDGEVSDGHRRPAAEGPRPHGDDDSTSASNGRGRASRGAVVEPAVEPPAVESDEAAPKVDREPDAPAIEQPPARRRRARRRAAKRDEDGAMEQREPRGRAAKRDETGARERRLRGRAARRAGDGAEHEPRGRAARRAVDGATEPKLSRRAARRAEAARLATPAARRAELVATAAMIAEAAAAAEAQPAPTPRRAGKIVRRAVAFIAILMIPASVYALVVTDGPATTMSHADASYLSTQLITADQRVRKQLVRLRPRHTSPALARTRDATLTARSLALEAAGKGGAEARLLQRAVKLEAAWLDAVGSVLSNPRSPLRGDLVALDARLRPALAALPGPAVRRKGGAPHLVRYARSRAAAASARG